MIEMTGDVTKTITKVTTITRVLGEITATSRVSMLLTSIKARTCIYKSESKHSTTFTDLLVIYNF